MTDHEKESHRRVRRTVIVLLDERYFGGQNLFLFLCTVAPSTNDPFSSSSPTHDNDVKGI